MPIVAAQREFDSNLALALGRMAEWIEGRSSAAAPSFNNCFEGPKRKLETYCREEPQPKLAAQLQTLISLDGRIESLMISLTEADTPKQPLPTVGSAAMLDRMRGRTLMARLR